MDYIDLLEVTKILTGDPAKVRQVYVRAVFNILAGNSDYHAKNHTFHLDSTAKWRINPACALTPSSLRLQQGIRSTSVLGNKNEKIPLSTFNELAYEHVINNPIPIVQQVSEAIKKWGDNIFYHYGNRMNAIYPLIRS